MKQSLPSLLWASRARRSWLTDVLTWLPLVDGTRSTGPFWISAALGALQKSMEPERMRHFRYQSIFNKVADMRTNKSDLSYVFFVTIVQIF